MRVFAALLTYLSVVAAVETLVGAHYYPGWWSGSHSFWTADQNGPGNGNNWLPQYAFRKPLNGLFLTDHATVTKDVTSAGVALDFFNVLFQDPTRGGAWWPEHPECNSPDPALGNSCINMALSWMLNSTDVWSNAGRLHFFISYSNEGGGPSLSLGSTTWESYVSLWLRAMGHPRYLRVNGRPVFAVLDPEQFEVQAGGASAAAALLQQLRTRAHNAGVGEPIIGNGWLSPGNPSSIGAPYDFGGSYGAADEPCYWGAHGKLAGYKCNTAAPGVTVGYDCLSNFDIQSRGNHTHDKIPYMPNIHAGWDPRPWHVPLCGFYAASEVEWTNALRAAKQQVESIGNRFGLPNAAAAGGVQPALTIYAWNEFGEGGIVAPVAGEGDMKVRSIAKVFGRAQGSFVV